MSQFAEMPSAKSTKSTFIKTDWSCTNVVFVRHGESSNNCIYEQVRQKFNGNNNLTDEEFEKEVDKLHDPDCGLSSRGQRQAEALKNHLLENQLEMIKNYRKWSFYTSPMNRTLLTAQQVSRGFNDDILFHVHPKLFESDGCYQPLPNGSTVGIPGMSKEEVENKFSNFKCLDGMENGWFQLKQKETRKEFYERSKEMSEFLWNEHDKNHNRNHRLGYDDVESDSNSEVSSPKTCQTTSIDENDEEVIRGKEGIFIVAHGNIIASIISNLVHTNALFSHCNTGISHVQLWSHKVTKHRLASIISVNRVPHFINQPELYGGEQIFEDHWIQEFLAPEDS